jgi:hypothetical protein
MTKYLMVWGFRTEGKVVKLSHLFFSWEQMGDLDLAAVIDYTLNITGQNCLFYVGHSMGSAMFFILMSSQPEYNIKIRASFQLAPDFYFIYNNNFQVSEIIYDSRTCITSAFGCEPRRMLSINQRFDKHYICHFEGECVVG